MQKTNTKDDTTIIFKVNSKTKNRLIKRATLQGKTLSEYMRDLVETKKQKIDNPNPLLKLAGFLNEQEAIEYNDNIYSNRQNKD
jgi:hypothetical protein